MEEGALDDTLRGGSIALGPGVDDDDPTEADCDPFHLYDKRTQVQ